MDDKSFSALYRNHHPVFWKDLSYQYDLLRDAKGNITVINALGKTGDDSLEYRYNYIFDSAGNWIERRELVLKYQNDLLIPQPSLSGRIWHRRINYKEYQ